MATAAAHYERLLSRHYTWMLGGDLERAATQEHELLAGLGVEAGALAVDLGCGPGPQTLALADLGFARVVGIDISHELLDELKHHARSRPSIEAVNGDLVKALPSVLEGARADVIVCMRDTVLHLPDRTTVVKLFGALLTFPWAW